MKRAEILDLAKAMICQDRNNSYGEPEASFDKIAEFWNVYLNQKYGDDFPITPEDVCWMLALMKVSRNTHQRKTDNYTDFIGYGALAYEVSKPDEDTRPDGGNP